MSGRLSAPPVGTVEVVSLWHQALQQRGNFWSVVLGPSRYTTGPYSLSIMGVFHDVTRNGHFSDISPLVVEMDVMQLQHVSCLIEDIHLKMVNRKIDSHLCSDFLVYLPLGFKINNKNTSILEKSLLCTKVILEGDFSFSSRPGL